MAEVTITALELISCLRADVEQLMLHDASERLTDLEREAAIEIALTLAWYLRRTQGSALVVPHRAGVARSQASGPEELGP